jgi:hypothetical protein
MPCSDAQILMQKQRNVINKTTWLENLIFQGETTILNEVNVKLEPLKPLQGTKKLWNYCKFSISDHSQCLTCLSDPWKDVFCRKLLLLVWTQSSFLENTFISKTVESNQWHLFNIADEWYHDTLLYNWKWPKA